jgi:hypothetical protein
VKWELHPDRIRETWTNRYRSFVVYWDINADTGIAWDRDQDREGEPTFISRYILAKGGFRRDV